MPLCIFFPKMSAYREDFDETKDISFDKRWWIIRKIQWNLGKILKIVLKKNLTVNLFLQWKISKN